MVSFDLQGNKQVGARIVAAIRRAAGEDEIALDCTDAVFLAAVNFDTVKFAEANFTGATFNHGLRLRGASFGTDVGFDRVSSTDFSLEEATFAGDAGFRGLRVASLSVRDVQFGQYASFDQSVIGFGNFRDVEFAAEARFRSLTSRGALTMRSVRFAATASFQDGSMRALAFPGCEFKGPLQLRETEVEDEISMVGARLEDTRALELCAGTAVSLRDATFAQPLAASVESPLFDATGACFEQGADILLAPGGRGRFATAAFGGPSLIMTSESGESPATVESLDGTRVDRLTLRGLNLSECSFARLHRLDDVLISGRGQLALAPEVVEASYRREILADEVVWRSSEPARGLQWAPTEWKRPEALAEQAPLPALAIADLYRAMRKAREDSHDFPGAADFYYGEMEMRRNGADSWIERAVLALYWLISGYGMRAARALLAFVGVVLLLAIGFQVFGFEQAPTFSRTVAWTLTASVSLTRPVDPIDLTPAGMYLNVAARVLGPALLALGALALRSRVRR